METKHCVTISCSMYKLKVKTVKKECISCGKPLVNPIDQLLDSLLFKADANEKTGF